MGRRALRWLVALAILGGMAAVGAETSDVEAATRPKVTWSLPAAPILDLDTCPGESFQPSFDTRGNLTKIVLALCPGGQRDVDVEVTPDAPVNVARAVLQTASGARVLQLAPTSYPTQIPAGTAQPARLRVEIPPGFRGTRASGRIYLRDRGSVLGPPLDVQLIIVQPTPEERALTPVVVPTNHIRAMANRFNIRALTVISGTNVTWTNYDTRQHRVVGRLCTNLTGPCSYDPAADPAAPTSCPLSRTNGVDDPTAQTIACIDSGPMNAQGKFSVRLTRPDRMQALRYEMDDEIDPSILTYTGCRRTSDPNGASFCFLTVK